MEARRVLGMWCLGGWSFNLVWEIAQRPLYANYLGPMQHLWGCFVASLGDLVILAALFGLLAAASSSWRWYHGSRWRWLALAAAGVTIASAIEYRALYLGSWTYADAMPLVPGLNLGASPILQMVIGPVALASMSRRWSSRRRERARRKGNGP